MFKICRITRKVFTSSMKAYGYYMEEFVNEPFMLLEKGTRAEISTENSVSCSSKRVRCACISENRVCYER